jgi:hypothetical protein
MSTWDERMPAGMFLKSEGFASSLSSPQRGLTLADYCAESAVAYSDIGTPVSLQTFTSYGRWFQSRAVPHLEALDVVSLEQRDGGFRLVLADGSELQAGAAVVAVGPTPFAYTPPVLAGLGGDRITHSAAHGPLDDLVGRRVIVIGAGQSALETAALLHEAGGDVQVLARRDPLNWNTNPCDLAFQDRLRNPMSGLGHGWSQVFYARMPAAFRRLGVATRTELVRRALPPAGSWWLRERMREVPVRTGQDLLGARHTPDGVRLDLEDRQGRRYSVEAEHVIAATGYRVDLTRVPFLHPTLVERLVTPSGWPTLSPSFSSNKVLGLFLVGQPAALTFGPVQRFVYGAGFAATSLTAALSRRSRPAVPAGSAIGPRRRPSRGAPSSAR